MLEQSLPMLFSQSLADKRYEVVIVADPSEDDTVEWARSYQPGRRLRVLEQPRHSGLSAARNRGILEASGEIILLMDDDVLCDATLLENHLSAHLAAPSPLVAFGPVHLAPTGRGGVTMEWAKKGDDWIDVLHKTGIPRFPEHTCIDANNSVRRSLLIEAGLFDEKLQVRENIDLGCRLWKMGARFRFLPEARAFHLYSKTASDLIQRDAPRYGREELLVCEKHPEYRPYSALTGIGRGGRTVRALRKILVSMPDSALPLLTVIGTLLSSLPGGDRLMKQRVRLLEIQQGIAMYNSALAESGGWSQLVRQFGVQCPVLLYHHVGPNVLGEHADLTVSPEQFVREARMLVRRGYTTIGPTEWADWVERGVPLPPKPVMITFDDAYADIGRYALPVLSENGQTATVFTIANLVGSRIPWDGTPVMDGSAVRYWAHNGMTIGSHTCTHPDLRGLDAATLQKEIISSKKSLEDIVGEPIETFAYPFGLFDDAARTIVRRTYRTGFSTLVGLNSISTDLAVLRRVMVHKGRSILLSRARLALGYAPIPELRMRLALRTRFRRSTAWLRSSD